MKQPSRRFVISIGEQVPTFFGPPDSVFLINHELITFPGGEPHFKLLNNPYLSGESVDVYVSAKNFNDIGKLLVVCDALKRVDMIMGNLFIPYFPGARQDRSANYGDPLTVKVYADIINSLKFGKVYILDVHSDVTPALIENVVSVSNLSFIIKVLGILADMTQDKPLLVSPDAGASKKIYSLAKALVSYGVIECSKTRNTITGDLSGFKVNADDLNGQDCLIVDDICDGGGTFIGLASELRKKNCGNLFLAVTHGIFSKGVDAVSEHFDQVFSTDSFGHKTGQRFVQIKLDGQIFGG